MKGSNGEIKEATIYRDEGCQLAAACLACPFERCFEEVPGGRLRRLKEERATEMRRLHQQGKGSREIACLFAVSQRTVQRALARVRHDN